MTATSRIVDIEETTAGWKHGGTVYATAVQAMKAVREMDEFNAKNSPDPLITIVRWEPKTRIGRMIVKAIT